MTNTYDSQSEHEYELLGRIKGKADQVVVYYDHTTLRVGSIYRKTRELYD
ncbi:MAG: hypothetical protein ACRD5B_09240 [Nitrososphaeraceae archaeon]